MNQYKPTVYEQIVQDFLSDKELNYEEYKEELAKRGWGDKRYFDAYVEDMKYIKSLMDDSNLKLSDAVELAKENHPSKDEDVLRFSLTPQEKQIVLKAEEMGSVKDGETITYEGYDKEIVCADYKNLPENADAFVIFSGHPGAAEPAVEAWFTDLKKTGKPKKLVFLGLYDNQGNTDFSQEGLKYNTGSEVEMYIRYCRSLGISEEILQECVITPTDTSTRQNTRLLAEIRNKYFDNKKEINFVMFGYPSYQKRIASEFSFEFQKMENDGEAAPTKFIMPAVPRHEDFRDRYLSYDNFDGVAQDIIIGNCLAHPYRVSAGGRFDSKLGTYPNVFKPLLPISLVYSYPNVAYELAGTDMNVGTMMRLLRAIQHKVYQLEAPQRVDKTIQYNLLQLRKKLTLEGLISATDIFDGNKLRADEALKRLKEHQGTTEEKQNSQEAAKVLLGSDNVNPKIVKNVAKFIKNNSKGTKR
ncbi:MAG: hypothetical protein E7004_01025 [Alphaproteobacteria bacterium]|nr:hypothetical protein [Alphaproteobacteria bacterium]